MLCARRIFNSQKNIQPKLCQKSQEKSNKIQNHKFLSRAIIWLNLIKMSSIDMFSHISMHIWWVFEEKIENFLFSFFFDFCHFFGILAICHIWLPDMRKQLIFWPKWLLAVPLGPTGSQNSKKSEVITLRLCRIHTYDFCLTTYVVASFEFCHSFS